MEESSIVKVVKKVLPAVVTITISKYLDVFENPFGQDFRQWRGSSGANPFDGPNFYGFEGFFSVPKGRKKIKIGGGSGFVVNQNGLILTNRHVVADSDAEYVVVLNEEKKYKAKILAKDPINDVAILKIQEKNLPVIKLGNSSELNLGQTVIAIGNTLGIFQNTVSAGVISGLSREIKATTTFEGKIVKLRGLIQTDAAINPGNSGGPLIDINGKAIGINSAMVFGAENIGFALPINTAKKDLEELKKYGRIRFPFLGIRYILLNKELRKRHNLPVSQGALVISDSFPKSQAVVLESPAQKAGLKELDIILEIEKEKISLKNSLEDILQRFKVGDEINLKILRQGKERFFKAVLAEKR